MLELVFRPLQTGKVARMEAINRINFAASFCASQQDVRRGDEHYGQFIVQRFVRPLKKLGARLGGTVVSMVMTRQAKHNQYGRIELMGYAPHIDPIRCSSSWHGLNWLVRIQTLKERLVRFKTDGSFDFEAQYAVPTYRAATQGRGERKDLRIGKVTYRNNWAAFFAEAGVLVGKLTSQWRIQAFHEMDESGMTDSQMARMSGHRAQGKDQTAAQAQNYQTNLSVHGLAQRAGCPRPHKPETHNVPSQSVTTVVHEFFKLLCGANLVLWQAQIHCLHAKCKTHGERQQQRLITGKHFVDSLVYDVENAIRLLASRPRDPVTGKLVGSRSHCYYDNFRDSTTFYDLFNHEAFRCQIWEDVKQAVRTAEDSAESLNIDALIAQPVHNEIQRSRNEIVTMFQAHSHVVLDGVNRAMQGYQSQMLSMMQSQMANYGILPSGPSPGNAMETPANPSSCHRFNAVAGMAKPLVGVPVCAPIPLSKRPMARNNKRVGIPMDQVRAAELPRNDGVPRPLWKGKDRDFKCYDDWWNFYVSHLKPLEDEHGTLCFRDEFVPVLDPETGETTMELPRHNKNWFSVRHAIWDAARHRIYTLKDSEEKVLADYRELYDSCRPSKDGHPIMHRKAPLEKLHKKFMAELERYDQKKRGRPRGSSAPPRAWATKRNRCAVPARNPGVSFEDAFDVAAMTPEEVEDCLDRLPAGCTEEEKEEHWRNRAAEKKSREANIALQRKIAETERLEEEQRQRAQREGGFFFDSRSGTYVSVPDPNAQYYQPPVENYDHLQRRRPRLMPHADHYSQVPMNRLSREATPTYRNFGRASEMVALAREVAHNASEYAPSPSPPPTPPERERRFYNIPNPEARPKCRKPPLPAHLQKQLDTMRMQAREKAQQSQLPLGNNWVLPPVRKITPPFRSRTDPPRQSPTDGPMNWEEAIAATDVLAEAATEVFGVL